MQEKHSPAEVRTEAGSEETQQFIRRVRGVTRRKLTPEEKVRIVLEGFRGVTLRAASIFNSLTTSSAPKATTPLLTDGARSRHRRSLNLTEQLPFGLGPGQGLPAQPVALTSSLPAPGPGPTGPA